MEIGRYSWGHWHSDNNPDGPLKPGVKYSTSPTFNDAKVHSSQQDYKKSVTFQMEELTSSVRFKDFKFSGPLPDVGAPNSGVGISELN